MTFKSLSIVTILALFSSAAWAQAPSPAQMGISSDTPNVVQVYDSSKHWATVGTVDPVTHLFSPAGVAGVLPPLVNSFNTRMGVVTLNSGDVTGALGFTPYNNTNPASYQTAAQVTTSLAPYAPLASPVFTGAPSMPIGATGITQTAGDNSTKLATTAFVGTAITAGAYILPKASTTVLGGVKVDGSTINVDSGGVISGTPPAITANSTPTSAFLANQLMISDGTKTQAVKSGTVINLGDAPGPGYPVYLLPLSTSSGFFPHLQITGQVSDNYGISIFTGGNSGKNGINMGAGPSSGLPYNFFGFTSTNDGSNPSPDIAFTSSGRGIAAFRDFGDGTRPESLRVYNTFTDFSNGEWGGIDWQSNPNMMTVGPSANGTGTLRNVVIGSGGNWMSFNPAGFTIIQSPYFYAQNGGQYMGAPWSYWAAVYSSSFVTTGGIAGVSCAAGTVSLTTLVVTNGIVTHC